MKMISLERIYQYLEIEHEPTPTTEGVPPAYWPASGDLKVEHLYARYSQVRSSRSSVSWITVIYALQDGPNVLHDISFEVKAGERVGIGRFKHQFEYRL